MLCSFLALKGSVRVMSNLATILISGDTHLGGGRIYELAQKGDAKNLFRRYLSLIEECDLSITNLESPVTNGGIPIAKTGPNLKSPVDSLPVLKKAGFDLVTLANNHIMDYGTAGLESTLQACQDAGLSTTGAGLKPEAAMESFFKVINGINVAVLNIAENEFGTARGGEPGGHAMDPIQNYYAIQGAAEKADRVVVIVHGGHEHYKLPSPRMKKTYRFYADAGADAVVGHHTHCISGYEQYRGTPIFYSLGNFLFDRNRNSGSVTPWNLGMMVKLTVGKGDDIRFDLHPYIQSADSPGLQGLTLKEQQNFQEQMLRLNKIIENDEDLEKSFNEYCDQSERLYSSYIEPHSVRILHALRNRNLLPSLLTSRKKRLLFNLVRCESHRDVLIKTLSS